MNPARYRKKSKERTMHMAATATSTFDGNFYTTSMRSAITFARSAGYQRHKCDPAFLSKLHRTITNHDLGENSYRTSEVTFAEFKAADIPLAKHIPGQVNDLCRDIDWLLTSEVDTITIVARVMIRLVAMQPFQDGNKRTAFTIAAFIMAWRGLDGILIPDKRDNEMFCRAVFNGNEGVIVLLLNRWLAPYS